MTWIVHVGGLGWSGSGAILDALLDTDRFRSLKGKTTSVSESRLFSGRPTLPSAIAGMTALSGDDVLALWTARERVPEGAVLAAPVRRLLERSPSSTASTTRSFVSSRMHRCVRPRRRPLAC